MAYQYIPSYVRQVVHATSKQVITAERWNELFNLLITQGDNTAEAIKNFLMDLNMDGADNIGTTYNSAAMDLQSALNLISAAIAARSTSVEMTAAITAAKNACLTGLSFNSEDGKFTINKGDGTTTVIDTNIEKIPASLALETVGNVTNLVITNSDGSQTSANVSSLIDAYTFSGGPCITVTSNGAGNTRSFTFSIADGAIGLNKLTPEAQSTLLGYKNDAQTAAASALSSANMATAKSSASATSANEAAVSAAAAVQSVASAAEASSAAGINSGIAVAKAAEAAASASSAAGSAAAAADSAAQAATIVGGDFATRTEAQGYADDAKSEAISAAAADATEKADAAQAASDPSGSAATVQANLNAHTGRADNPHGVTAAQIGAATAVEQRAMAPLLRLQTGLGNEYIWEKYTTHPDGTKAILNNYLFLQNPNPTTFTVYYANSFTVISDTNGLKKFQLVNPSTLGFTTNNVATGDPLKGKYCLVGNYAPLIYFPPEAVFTTPNGAGLQVFVSVCTKYGAPTNKKTVHSYVNSADPNAYPISDGYLYNSLGKLGNRSWVLSGSYMGTGVYGSANPNVLTFPSEPKLFIVQCAATVGDSYFPRGLTITSSYCTDFILWTSGQKSYSICAQGTSAPNNPIDSGQNSLSWYSASGAACQMNVLSMVYHYVAIGG